MYQEKKVVVVMPAYNAEKTIKQTHAEVFKQGIVDLVVVVDDCSSDRTVEVAQALPDTIVHEHASNTGYGGNQKSCYRIALEHGADIIIMVHPDYQYTPLLIPAMATMIGNQLYHAVLGSRILGGYALKGGMPLWKYVANRCLTLFQNIFIGAKLSEYHTGYRAFSRELLEDIDFENNSDDFVFDNEMLSQVIWKGYQIGEITCPTKYFEEASSINFQRSAVYGLGCLKNSVLFRANKLGLISSKIFS